MRVVARGGVGALDFSAGFETRALRSAPALLVATHCTIIPVRAYVSDQRHE